MARPPLLLVFPPLLLGLYLLTTLAPSPQCTCNAPREAEEAFAVPDNVTLAALNTTGRVVRDQLMFNRVPKVGSTSINHLLGLLATRNGFQMVAETGNRVEQVTMDRKGEEELVKWVVGQGEGSVVSKHVAR